MGVLILLLVIAVIGWMIFVQVKARQQSSIHTSQGRTAVHQAVDEVFGRSWTRVNGPGYVNLKPKMRAYAPTISIDVDPGGQGGSDVDIWMSAWQRRYGVVAHAQLVWRKERQLTSRLGGTVGQSTMAAAGTGPTSTPRTPSTTRPKAGAVSPVKRAAVDGQKAAKPRTGTPQNNISGDDSKSALVCKVVADSDCSFIVRTNKAPREIAAAVERSLKGVQQGSMNHLLIGPPRATMWAYILESKGASNILAISLVTKENQDREYVEQSIRAPLTDSVLKDIDGKLEIRSAESPLGRLRDEILHARLVPVSEYSS